VLTQLDKNSIAARGTPIETIERQLAIFHRGIPYTTIIRPCAIRDGIKQISNSEFPKLEETFSRAMNSGRVTKFVPASGAASRMFKSLLACCEEKSSSAPLQQSEKANLEKFLDRLFDFAFYKDLAKILADQGHNIEHLSTERNFKPILEALLYPTGLNYASQPKGLLAFHQYTSHTRTPIEEHLLEAAAYAKAANNKAQVHFTISPEHAKAFQEHIQSARERLKQSDIDWVVTYSLQKASSDTIAVDMNNQPFRDQGGNLLFRPGGHGALISNVSDLQGDIIFIKNIDNVAQDHLKEKTYIYKRVLGGYLTLIQQTLFGYLHHLERKTPTTVELDDMFEWAEYTFHFTIPQDLKACDLKHRIDYLRQFFHRPIRVCGMVKNTGDPGGGPFWIRHDDGTTSIQIIESSQVDPYSTEQQDMFASSTHFNPVDIVCGVRDYKGNLLDLSQYIDPNTGFISQKSYDGRELKTLELPGLWNGAMAKWHTILVEVPRATFSPVKTVLDLLLPAHQPQ
jgi:hypothetical protein